MSPLVSIVMPTRGRPAYVERAIASVLAQSFPDFELLILDNSAGSEKDRIREMSRADSRIVFVERGDIGVTEARKVGAVLSRGKLFALLDSDDYWDPERLEKHVEVWSHNRIGLSWDRWAEVHRYGSSEFPQPFAEGLIQPPKLAARLYRGNFIHASAGIVSTAFARTMGFPPLGIMSSDWTLFMRAAEYYPAYFIGQTLSFKDTGSPERVSDLEKEFLRKETLIISRWFLLREPGIYGVPYLKTRLNRILRRVRYTPVTYHRHLRGTSHSESRTY